MNYQKPTSFKVLIFFIWPCHTHQTATCPKIKINCLSFRCGGLWPFMTLLDSIVRLWQSQLASLCQDMFRGHFQRQPIHHRTECLGRTKRLNAEFNGHDVASWLRGSVEPFWLTDWLVSSWPLAGGLARGVDWLRLLLSSLLLAHNPSQVVEHATTVTATQSALVSRVPPMPECALRLLKVIAMSLSYKPTN